MVRTFTAFAILALLSVVGLTAALLAGAATRSVAVQDDSYVDGVSGTSTTTIAVGDTVQWNWSGANQHTVDNNGGSESFSSGAPQDTGSFSHVFNAVGTYNYICGVHGTAMQGTIIVQAGQAPTSTPVVQSTSTSAPQPSSTPVANATATNTPAASGTETTPIATSEAGTLPSATAALVASTPGSSGSGTLPSAGHGRAGDREGHTRLVGAFLVALAGGVAMGGLVLARRVVR